MTGLNFNYLFKYLRSHSEVLGIRTPTWELGGRGEGRGTVPARPVY